MVVFHSGLEENPPCLVFFSTHVWLVFLKSEDSEDAKMKSLETRYKLPSGKLT